MNEESVAHLSTQLIKEGIPNTYEYPGYILINYRGVSVTVGIDSNILSVGIDDNGKEVLMSYDNSLNVAHKLSVDIMPRLKAMLAAAYRSIDIYKDPEHAAKRDLLEFVQSIAYWMQEDRRYDLKIEVDKKIQEARDLLKKLED